MEEEIDDLEVMNNKQKEALLLLYTPLQKPSLDHPPMENKMDPEVQLKVYFIHLGFLQYNPSPTPAVRTVATSSTFTSQSPLFKCLLF